MEYLQGNLKGSSDNLTIPKNIILNWIYATDRHVSVSKFCTRLEEQTDGKYKMINTSYH